MDYVGTLHFAHTQDQGYSVTFTPRDPGQGQEARRTFATENDFELFLLDAGFGAQHADGIQGALESVGHHTVNDRVISERQWRQLFAEPSARAANP